MRMKRNLCFFVVFFAFSGFTNLLNAQNVGITDKSGGITPANPLQVHKETKGSNTLIQMSNQITGETAGDGFQLGIDGYQNGFIINKETGKNIILGGSNIATDNTTIENDGTVVFNGAATTWDELRGSGSAIGTGSSPVMVQFTGNGPLFEWSFSHGTSDKCLYYELQLPHGWNQGSRIYPHVHWTPSTNGTGNVVWKMDYIWQNIGEVYGLSSTIKVSTPAIGTAWQHEMSNFQTGISDGIAATGKTISSILICRIYRDGSSVSDTYPDPVSLIGFDVLYEINTVGSHTPTTK